MKNLKKFLAVLLVAAMVTGFSGNVCRAKTKSDVYGDLIKQLKKKEQFADGVYTAKIHDASGNDIKTGFLEIRASSEEFDENGQITNYDELMSELRKVFEKEGFKYSVENSDTTGGETGRSDRYVCFIKGDVQVVVQNNHTRHFFIYVYKTGDWKLNK